MFFCLKITLNMRISLSVVQVRVKQACKRLVLLTVGRFAIT